MISEARTGKKDISYPALYTLDAFAYRGLPLALHVCGKMALSVGAKGNFNKVEEFMGRYYDMFERMQLNIGRGSEFRAFSEMPENKKIIIQYTTASEHYNELYATYKDTKNVSFLIDQSGGNGIYSEFVDFMPEEQYKGFAGGLTPDNVEDSVKKILTLGDFDFDIDMQSGVRTDNVFDLEKCRKVCQICEKYH